MLKPGRENAATRPHPVRAPTQRVTATAAYPFHCPVSSAKFSEGGALLPPAPAPTPVWSTLPQPHPQTRLGAEAADVADLGFQAFFGDSDSNPKYFSYNKDATGLWCALRGCARWGEKRGCGPASWVCQDRQGCGKDRGRERMEGMRWAGEGEESRALSPGVGRGGQACLKPRSLHPDI